MEIVMAFIIGVITGAAVGVLVYRNNSARFEKSFGKVESMLSDISRRIDYNNDGRFDLADIEKLINDKLDELNKNDEISVDLE